MRSSRTASRKEEPVKGIVSQFVSQLTCEEKIELLEDLKAAIAEELAQGRTASRPHARGAAAPPS